MALAQPGFPDRKPSGVPFSSTNPFRNRRPSPAAHSLTSPAFPSGSFPNPAFPIVNAPTQPPISRNPFLAVFDDDHEIATQQTPPKLTAKGMSFSVDESTPKRAAAAKDATNVFNNLKLDNKPPANGNVPYEPTMQHAGAKPSSSHRPTRSQEEAERLALNGIRGSSNTRGALIQVDLFDRVVRGSLENRRPRRNSESSVLDKGDERKRRERRQREKDGREKDGKPRDVPSSKSRRANAGLDLIDKLDVTGIYGTGLFHHDGPFDACNPHRNRKKNTHAPMQAFPEGSANNSMGGSGPVNKTLNIDQYHGRGMDGFNDYNATANGTHTAVQFDQYGLPLRPQQMERQYTYDLKQSYTMSPTDRGEQVHGEVSAGLGSSTFLDGAPAPRSAMQRRDSENPDTGYALPGGALTRKKSLMQKMRGMSRPRTGISEIAPLRSPEARYNLVEQYRNGEGSPPQRGVQSAGGRGMMMDEKNPFFEECDVKGATTFAAPVNGRTGRGSGDGNRGRSALGLTRRMTEGGKEQVEAKSGPSGFLSRVKSLRGGRRTRPERAGS